MIESSHSDAHWYAIRTRANREKVVRTHLDSRGIESLLPTYAGVKLAGKPAAGPRVLIPGYVFAKFPLIRRIDVVSAPGVAFLLADSSGPTKIPQHEIDTLRIATENYATSPAAYPTTGQWVRINTGMLAGVTGRVREIRQQARVVVQVQSIRSAFLVVLDAAHVVVLGERPEIRSAVAMTVQGVSG